MKKLEGLMYKKRVQKFQWGNKLAQYPQQGEASFGPYGSQREDITGVYDPYKYMSRGFVDAMGLPYPIDAENKGNIDNTYIDRGNVQDAGVDPRPFIQNIDGTAPMPNLIGNQIRPEDISTIQARGPQHTPGPELIGNQLRPEDISIIQPTTPKSQDIPGYIQTTPGGGSGTNPGGDSGTNPKPKPQYSGGRDKSEFDAAFAKARNSGLNEFEFGGKKFSTWRKGEEAERKQAASSVGSMESRGITNPSPKKKTESVQAPAIKKTAPAKKAPAKKKKDRGKPGTVFSRARDNFKKNRAERRAKRKSRRAERRGENVKTVKGTNKVNSEIRSGNTSKKDKGDINKKNDKSAAIKRGKI